jgi:hypothetical protein
MDYILEKSTRAKSVDTCDALGEAPRHRYLAYTS